jgi:hypothetical protein
MPLFNRRELDERARKYGFNRDKHIIINLVREKPPVDQTGGSKGSNVFILSLY